LSGFAGATGPIGEKPEFSPGTAYLDWSGAMMNVVAVLAGLHRRRATGEGAMLSTSQFGTSVFVGASRLVTASPDPARLGHDFGVACLTGLSQPQMASYRSAFRQRQFGGG
jgi:crotonobetainyl-CoA:carnitine CoA-transferase CaiB-like acyl-CoA transferase